MGLNTTAAFIKILQGFSGILSFASGQLSRLAIDTLKDIERGTRRGRRKLARRIERGIRSRGKRIQRLVSKRIGRGLEAIAGRRTRRGDFDAYDAMDRSREKAAVVALRVAKKFAPRDTGDLREGLFTRTPLSSVIQIEFDSDAPYFDVVVQGTTKKNYPITAVNASALAFKWARASLTRKKASGKLPAKRSGKRGGKLVFFKSITHPGVKGQDQFIREGQKAYLRALPLNITREFSLELAKLFK